MHADPMAWAMSWWSIQRISSLGSLFWCQEMTLLSNALLALSFPTVQESPSSGGGNGSFRFLVNIELAWWGEDGGSPSSGYVPLGR